VAVLLSGVAAASAFTTSAPMSLRTGATKSTSLGVCRYPLTLGTRLNMADDGVPSLAGPPKLVGPPPRQAPPAAPSSETIIDGTAKAGTPFSPSYLSIFQEWDRDGNGLIDVDEFQEVMKKLRQQKSSTLTEVEADLATADSYGVDMETLFSSMDTDGNELIDFTEFMAAAGIKKEEVDFEKNIHKMPEKFHGTMKGKGAVVVSRVEKDAKAVIAFSKEQGGSIAISGTKSACKDAWYMLTHVKKVLPGLLTKLRSGDMVAGDFGGDKSLAGSIADDKVWLFAVDEAMYLWTQPGNQDAAAIAADKWQASSK